jgi:hypothetical protein
MADYVRVVRATFIRPVVAGVEDQRSVGIEVLALDGDRFVIALSGEGLQGLGRDIQDLLESDPTLAEIKSLPRQ